MGCRAYAVARAVHFRVFLWVWEQSFFQTKPNSDDVDDDADYDDVAVVWKKGRSTSGGIQGSGDRRE